MNKSKLLTIFSVSILVLGLAAFIGLVIVLPSLESVGEASQATATAPDLPPVLEVYSPYPGLSPITVENAAQISRLDTLSTSFYWVNDLTFSPSQEWLTVMTRWEPKVWDLRNQVVSGVIPGFVSGEAIFSPDGSLVALNGEYIMIYDPVAGEFSEQIEGGPTLYFKSLALTDDGSRLVTGSGTGRGTYGRVQLWDFQTGALLYSVSQDVSVHHVDVSPDGSLIASGDVSPVIRLWDAQLEPLAELKGQSMTTDLAFSPDGTLLASADGMSLRLWDLSSRTEKLTLEGHREMIMTIAFSPDGSLLASAGKDGTLRLWEVSTGQALAVLALSSQDEKGNFQMTVLRDNDGSRIMPSSSRTWLTAVTFSPDGTLLAAGHGVTAQVHLLGVPLSD